MVRDVRHLDRFVGRTLPLRVLEVDRRTNKVILSHKQAVEEDRRGRREKTLARLYEGAVCEGRVVSLTNYGAFIDLGGIDGLLHISEMAWHHVDHPSEVLKKGDLVRVVVLSIEDEGNRISLSRREILPDPWKEVLDQFSAGQALEVEVARMVSTGAFAKLPGLEVEGFIPLREMAEQRIRKPEEALQLGQKVEVKILDIQPSARKMTLSVVQAGAQRERAETQRFMSSRASTGTGVNLGEQFGDILRGALAPPEEPIEEVVVEEPARAQAEALTALACETSAEEAPAEAVEEPAPKKRKTASRAKKIKQVEPQASVESPEAHVEPPAEAAGEALAESSPEETSGNSEESAEASAEELSPIKETEATAEEA
jgi:predicted RNA-binding protein with RPS1 domain